ncbi:MAG TPA: hypothetical protein VEO74_03425 [Thermoanaerobaculia bacterium]|nr:hypothetical protein [Thermoanaerobaculia bacterium]
MRPATAVLLVLLASSTALGQNTPPPSSPFPPPIIAYEGRYVDSAQTPDFQFPDRTLRTYKAKTAPELNLMLVSLSGSAFAAYDLTTLPPRLASAARSTGAHGEKYLPPDIFFDAQNPGSGFTIIPQDGQIFLRDFDYDDRGDFYLAYSAWGFGLIDRNAHLLSQVLTPAAVARRILSVRLAGSYYALVSDLVGATAVYDVTNAASPALVRVLPFGIIAYAKGNSAVAVVTGTHNSTLRFYTPSALVAGNAPFQEIVSPSENFVDVTTDGSRFFALLSASVATLTPQTNVSYSESYTPLPFNALGFSISYGAGYLGVPALFSSLGAVYKGLLLFTVGGSGLTDSSYVIPAYSSPSIGPDSAVPFSAGGSTNLLLAYAGVGDVFELAPVTPIPAVSPFALGIVALSMLAIAALKLR